jgi:hypothetical protein
MVVTDKEHFLKVLNGMAAMKKAQLVPEVLDLWWACMADWSIEDFKAAAIEVIKRNAFMPCPNDFENLRKAMRPTAGEAWDLAVRHAATGAYRGGPLGDAEIDQCVRVLGGYGAIAKCDEGDLHYRERRFFEHYESISNSNQVRKALPQIAAAQTERLRLKLNKLPQ